MLVFDTQVVHFPAAPVVCYPPALDSGHYCKQTARNRPHSINWAD